MIMTQRRLSFLPASFATYMATLLVPAAMLAGCAAPSGGAGPSQASPGAPAAATAPADILGTWQLMRWEGVDDLPSLPESRAINLTFNDKGAFSGSGGCNRIFGQYSVGPAKGQVSLQAPAATRMACPDSMAFEARYLTTLPRVTRFERRDTQLILRTPNGETLTYASQTLLDRPVASATKTEDRIVDVDSQMADCVGVAPRKCLRVRNADDSGKAPWELWYAHIDGFSWKPGVEYRVKIHGEPVVNPPADASSMRWTLVEVIRETPAR
ncbi:META domain-containing protein [Pandoraea cepalis]|uniref:META domain-containing protein n=2 Tax=Pandoraea cepalis TaxID=2508294 RepID=A0A5E4UB43_9BURK|nr:META domain-containing protein [Pandoraea cepalis]